MSENEKSPLEKERSKTLRLLDTKNVKGESFESIPEDELEEASEDPENPEVYSEETEGKIAPQYKSGSSAVDTKKDSRFAKSHEFLEEEKDPKKNVKNSAKSGGGCK